MQHFIDTATQRLWAFEDNVVATETDGVYAFAYPCSSGDGAEPVMVAIEAPLTLQPHVVAEPSPSELAQQQLANAKTLVKAAIRKTRDELLLLTPFNGKLFQTDLASKIQIMNVVNSGSMPSYAQYWRTADNTYMTMTFELFEQLKDAIMAREGAAFGASALHQDNVGGLQTIEAVEAYDFSEGWPA